MKMETKLEILQRRKEIEQELADLLKDSGSDLKKKLIQEGYAEVSKKIGQLKLKAIQVDGLYENIS